MKRYIFAFALFFMFARVHSQEQPVLKLSPEQFEALFLKQNLLLIAEKMNIDVADAAIIQARLWENPELTVSSVNLWSTGNQRDGEAELIPPLFGSFARNTQFTVELSQLIQTANKRAKLVRMETVAKDIAMREFEDVLRGLKAELRKTVFDAAYIQSYLKILQTQSKALEQLINAYRKQVLEGNIARNELLRLQSSLLEIENEMNESSITINEFQKTLKALVNADPLVIIEFDMDSNPAHLPVPSDLSLSDLLNKSLDYRPDIQSRQLAIQYYEKSFAYEKALRIPDLTINANYDRFGGVWRDFLGVGVSIGLPLLNRNRGNIKAARLLTDQSRYLEEQQVKLAQNEIVEAYHNYDQAYRYFIKINDDDFLAELDKMLDIYVKNLQNRNISMLEFTDFMDTFRTSKRIVLESEKNVKTCFEDLQYVTATELVN